MPQILWSSCVLPQAGIADILIPCLTTQNISTRLPRVLVRLGGTIESVADVAFVDTWARWHAAHMAA